MNRLQLLKKGIALADRNIRLFVVYCAANAVYTLVLEFAVRTFVGEQPQVPENLSVFLPIRFGLLLLMTPAVAAVDCYVLGTLRGQVVEIGGENLIRRFYARALLFELLLLALMLLLKLLYLPFLFLLAHPFWLALIAYLFWQDCGVVRAVKEGSRAVAERLNAFLPVLLMGFFLYILVLVAQDVALKQVPELVRTLFVGAVLSYVDIAILCISFVLFIELPQKGPSSERNVEP